MDASAPSLRAERIRFGFGGAPLFDGLDAEFGPGVGLVVGGDGRGKTTLLRILAGDLPPASGDCVACGVRLSADPEGYRACVLPVGRGEEALAGRDVRGWFDGLARRWPGFDAALRDELVEGLQLVPHLGKTGEMLSTGTRRKVLLAGAIASRAPVTLIDDPFGALDFRSAACLAGLLRGFARSAERTLIVACHEPIPDLSRGSILDLGG